MARSEFIQVETSVSPETPEVRFTVTCVIGVKVVSSAPVLLKSMFCFVFKFCKIPKKV